MSDTKTEFGNTAPSDWKDYSGGGIYVDVNTTSGEFTKTPRYHVILTGDGLVLREWVPLITPGMTYFNLVKGQFVFLSKNGL